MSAHDCVTSTHDWSLMRISIVEFRVWDVMGQAAIQANVVYLDGDGMPHRRNIGAVMNEWTLQEPVTLGYIVYRLGREIQIAWRELSTPKE